MNHNLAQPAVISTMKLFVSEGKTTVLYSEIESLELAR